MLRGDGGAIDGESPVGGDANVVHKHDALVGIVAHAAMIDGVGSHKKTATARIRLSFISVQSFSGSVVKTKEPHKNTKKSSLFSKNRCRIFIFILNLQYVLTRFRPETCLKDKMKNDRLR